MKVEAKFEGLEVHCAFSVSPDQIPSLPRTGPESERHISLYPWTWLQKVSYDPKIAPQAERKECVASPPPASTSLPNSLSSCRKILWNSQILQSPPTVSYNEVMSDDHGLYKWLSNIVGGALAELARGC